jgi:hypothetical protein
VSVADADAGIPDEDDALCVQKRLDAAKKEAADVPALKEGAAS